MTSDGSNRLFEVGDEEGAELFEEDDLRRRTDFQSRAPRAGADFKEMAIRHRICQIVSPRRGATSPN